LGHVGHGGGPGWLAGMVEMVGGVQ
jgi:hypothetical protein